MASGGGMGVPSRPGRRRMWPVNGLIGPGTGDVGPGHTSRAPGTGAHVPGVVPGSWRARVAWDGPVHGGNAPGLVRPLWGPSGLLWGSWYACHARCLLADSRSPECQEPRDHTVPGLLVVGARYYVLGGCLILRRGLLGPQQLLQERGHAGKLRILGCNPLQQRRIRGGRPGCYRGRALDRYPW
jgi:hypothetical protein